MTCNEDPLVVLSPNSHTYARNRVAEFTVSFVNIYTRRCFSHQTRVGGSRGGGKRGGKGSLPRYLLDQNVPMKVMSRMMGKILLFNYLPGPTVFYYAMMLFLDHYKEYINDHMRTAYLDPACAWKLGGCASGSQGQVGSTNGAEKRCGVWQKQFDQLVKNHSGDKQNNFLRMLEGKVNVMCDVLALFVSQ